MTSLHGARDSAALPVLTAADLERLGPPLEVLRDAGGVLHLPGCLQLDYPVSRVMLPLLEVYGGRGRCPCGDFPSDPCLSSAFEELDAWVWIAELLASVATAVPCPPASALELLGHLDRASADLERLLDASSLVLVDLVGAASSAVGAEIRRLRALLEDDGVREGVLATAFLVGGARPVSDGWLRADVEDAFPGVGPAASAPARTARAAAFNAWVVEAAGGGDGRAAALEAVLSMVSLTSLEQLPDVPVEDLPSGLSLLSALRSCWRSRLVAEVSSMVDSWEAAAARARAEGPGEDVVVLFDPAFSRSNVYAPLVCSVYAVARSPRSPAHRSAPILLCLPRRVLGALRGPHEDRPRGALSAAPALPEDTSAVFETALSLWAESEDRSPEAFPLVLAAARTLCAAPLPS